MKAKARSREWRRTDTWKDEKVQESHRIPHSDQVYSVDQRPGTWRDVESTQFSAWSLAVVQLLLLESVLVQIWQSLSSISAHPGSYDYANAMYTVTGMAAACFLAHAKFWRTQTNCIDTRARCATATCSLACRAVLDSTLQLRRQLGSSSRNQLPICSVHSLRECASRICRLALPCTKRRFEILCNVFQCAGMHFRRPCLCPRHEAALPDDVELASLLSQRYANDVHPFESDPFLEFGRHGSNDSTRSGTKLELFWKPPTLPARPMDRGEATIVDVATHPSSSSKWL
jgi:hypothetical protein